MTWAHCAKPGCDASIFDSEGCKGYFTPEDSGWGRVGGKWYCPAHKPQGTLELGGSHE